MEGERAGTADSVSWSRAVASVVCPLPHLSLGHCFMEVQYASGSGALPMFFYFFNFSSSKAAWSAVMATSLASPNSCRGRCEGTRQTRPVRKGSWSLEAVEGGGESLCCVCLQIFVF